MIKQTEKTLEWIELDWNRSFQGGIDTRKRNIALTKQTPYFDQTMGYFFGKRKYPFTGIDVYKRAADNSYSWIVERSFLLRSFLNEHGGEIPAWAKGIYVLLPPFDSSHGMGSFNQDSTFKVSFVDFIELNKKV